MSHHDINTYYVGGYVRDELMGIDSDDIDICLVGVKDAKKVEKILLENALSVTPLVGQKFPVWIADIDGHKVDFAIARKETLVGGTRKDFDVVTEGVTIEDDLKRRDFSINAIAKDVLTDEYIDPYGGLSCIQFKCLHPTSEAFGEDTLRVLRGARFLSRFPEFYASGSLVLMCMQLQPTDISLERVGIELKKTMEQAIKPSRFFNFLREVGWLEYHFKEVYDLISVPQSPVHHPEGDVYTHTMLALDEAKDPFTRICMLCHDMGKATTTTIEHHEYHSWLQGCKDQGFSKEKIDNILNLGKIRSIGHEIAGIKPTRDLLTRISYADRKYIRQVECMVELHMIRASVSEKVVRRTLRKLMDKGLQYNQLVEVCRCDISSRPPLAGYTPDIGQYRAMQLLEENAMEPIVTGEKLLAAGYAPGKLIGELVKKGLEWQDRGTLREHNWLKMIKQHKPQKEVTDET